MRIKRVMLGMALGVGMLAAAPLRAAEDNPAIVKLRTVETRVSPDGLHTRTLHMEIQAANAAAAMQVGQQSIPFSESMEDLEVVEAYTAKANGERIPIGPNAVYTQQSQGSAQFPLFDDQRQRVIVFPSVAAQDTVVFTVRWTAKRAWIPGQFTSSSFYPKSVVYNEVRETIVAPKSLPLQVETHDLAFEKQETGDNITYAWRYSATTPTLDDPPRVSPLDSLPRFFVSSFKDHDAFGQAFAAIMASKETVTPRIQALADELTSGIRDRKQQAQKIYEWVSRNIRYVAIDIGNGGIVPHEADSVLANAYGDCKDHAVLFTALLKAKGIQSETVLINLGEAYTLPSVPTLFPMNHAITWLPDFKMYVDTTAGTAPFGVLPFEEYGKPVIHAIASGTTRRETPVLSPETAVFNLKTVAQLDKEGKVTGNTAVTAAGPFSISLRNLGLAIQGAGAARYAQAQLERQGLVGTGSFDVSSPTEIAGAYTLGANFSYGPKPEFVSGVRFDMIRGIWLGAFAGDMLMGPVFDERLKDSEPTACFSGRVVEEMTLQAPEGRQFTKLPENLNLRTRNLQFTTRWSVSRNTVTLRREFVSRIEQPLCDGATRRDTAKTLADIRRHYQFDLVSLTGPASVSLTVVLDGQALTRGIQSAVADMDWDSTIRLASVAIPRLTAPADSKSLGYAYNARGLAYRSKRDYGKAVADFSQVIRIDPNNYGVLLNRGVLYAQQKRRARALADFNSAIKINPNDPAAYNLRALAYFDRGLFQRAIEDCDTSIRLAPRDSQCYRTRSRLNYVVAQYDKTIADGDVAVRIAPQDRFSWYHRGLGYLATEKFRDAVSDFDATAKVAPDFAEALFARGVAQIRLGNDAAGDADIAAATKLNSNIAYMMAGFGVSKSTFVPGVDDLAACKTSDTSDVLQGMIYCTRTLAASNLPSDDRATAHRMLGRAYLRIGELDEAIANLDSALRLSPNDAAALAARGLSRARKGDADVALEDVNAAVMRAPGDAEVLMARGAVQALAGDTTAALADYDEAVRRAPDVADGYFMRARLYEESDQFDKAISDMNTLVRMGANPFSYAARCHVLTLADRLTAAMSDCEKALVEAPDFVGALTARGLIYLKLGQDSRAAEDFEHALTVDPNAALAYYGRGLLKLKATDATGQDDIAEATLIDADLVVRMRRRGLRP